MRTDFTLLLIIGFGQSAYQEESSHISHGSHVLHTAGVCLHSAKAEKYPKLSSLQLYFLNTRICFHVPVRDLLDFIKTRFCFRYSQLSSLLFTVPVLRSHFYKKSALVSFSFYQEVRTGTIHFSYPMEVLKVSGISEEVEEFLNSGHSFVLLQFSDQSTL